MQARLQFTPADLTALKARQNRARAAPLRKNTLLPFSLPSLYPSSMYSPSINPSSSPNVPRPASQSLLNILSDTRPRTLNLKLVRGIQKGVVGWSQVWRAELDVEGRKRKVVVKLYAEALHPIPWEPIEEKWSKGSEFAAREARAYTRLRSVQGLDIPICYGFFEFTAPWNEKVIGVILEDLTYVSIPLSSWGANYLRTGDGFDDTVDSEDSDDDLPPHTIDVAGGETDAKKEEEIIQVKEAVRKAQELKVFILRLFEAQRRLQSLGHQARVNENDILILRPDASSDPRFIFTGFCYAEVKEDAEETIREELAVLAKEYGEEEANEFSRDWREESELQLRCAVKKVFGEDVEYEWRKFGLVPFLDDAANLLH